jgi:hypothetical protein
LYIDSINFVCVIGLIKIFIFLSNIFYNSKFYPFIIPIFTIFFNNSKIIKVFVSFDDINNNIIIN